MLQINRPSEITDKLKTFVPAGAKWVALYLINESNEDYAFARNLINRLLPQAQHVIKGSNYDLPGENYLFAFGMN